MCRMHNDYRLNWGKMWISVSIRKFTLTIEEHTLILKSEYKNGGISP